METFQAIVLSAGWLVLPMGAAALALVIGLVRRRQHKED